MVRAMKDVRSTLALAALALAACSFHSPFVEVQRATEAASGSGNADSSAAADDTAGTYARPRLPPPEQPDPSPPAHRDADGTLHGPGGDPSDQPSDCGPAHNHCIPPNGWFAGQIGGPVDVPEPRVPVFKFEGRWYAWNGEEATGAIYRTVPATADNMIGAHEVYVYLRDRSGEGQTTLPEGTVLSAVPKSPSESITTRRWTRISVYKIDAKAGTFVADDAFTYEIAAARVSFDPHAGQ